MHLCVLVGGRRSTRGVPAALTSPLINEKPAAIGGVPFGYPTRGKVVIRIGRRRALMRGRGTVEGTFACALIDADIKLALHDPKSLSSLESCLNRHYP